MNTKPRSVDALKLIIGLGLFLSSSALAQSNTSREIQCFGKINNKVETFKTRLASHGKLVYWSETKIVDADKKSYFSWLADLEHFGLEGAGSFIGRNEYKILSVTNTAESIDIGVSKDFSTGFFNYRDGGSGLGNKRVPLVCKLLPKMPRW